MAKRPTKETLSWVVYHLKGTPAKLIGIVDAPDEQTADPQKQARLIAQRRD